MSWRPRSLAYMLVVADLDAGNDGAVEEAVTSAWRMQAEHNDGTGGRSNDW